MKTNIVLLIGLLFLNGCAKNEFLGYNSKSDRKQMYTGKNSKLHLIVANKEKVAQIKKDDVLTIGVYAGIDSPESKYIVLSKFDKSSKSGEYLQKYILAEHVSINSSNLDKVISFLEIVVNEWNDPISNEDGIFSSCLVQEVKSEYRADRSSGDSLMTFNMNYQKAQIGNILIISYSDVSFSHKIELKDRPSIDLFLTKLIDAKSYLQTLSIK
ncbi:MAG: hypothetical protein J0L62_14400 [Bacteroidetes bacterium]|nr:hypothetical protein [Bacteroidota bacterium]